MPDIAEDALPFAGGHTTHSNDARKDGIVQTGSAARTHAPLGAHCLEDGEGRPVIWPDLTVLSGEIADQEAKGLQLFSRRTLRVEGACSA